MKYPFQGKLMRGWWLSYSSIETFKHSLLISHSHYFSMSYSPYICHSAPKCQPRGSLGPAPVQRDTGCEKGSLCSSTHASGKFWMLLVSFPRPSTICFIYHIMHYMFIELGPTLYIALMYFLLLFIFFFFLN